MRRFTFITSVVSIISLLSVAGCRTEPVYFWDSVQFTDHYFTPRFAAVNHDALMHQPYVAGSSLTIHVASYQDVDMTGWSVDVDDESVLRIDEWSLDEDDADSLAVSVTATGEGDTLLHAVDDSGDVVASIDITVAQPDRVEIRPYGPDLVGDPDGVNDVDGYTLLLDGATNFDVDWYRGDDFLYGTGALTLEASEGLSTIEPTSFGDLIGDLLVDVLFAEREEMTLTALEPGAHTLTVRCNGETVREIEIEGVEADELDEIHILADSEAGADQGQHMHLVAQGYLAGGEPVFGIDYAWHLGGEESHGPVYSYQYDADLENEVEVSFDGLSDGIVIHGADEVEGGAAGCSVSGDGSGAGVAAGLLALALISVRRRS
jgi:MYXO-CTERM domain-containing protein